MYILRTLTKQGTWQELKTYPCIIRACSMAELLSNKALRGNVRVTNSRTRKSIGFMNGETA